MAALFVLLFLASIPTVIAGLIKPSLFSKLKISNRKQAGLSFGSLVILFFVLVGVTVPKDTNSASITGSQIPISSSQLQVKKLPSNAVAISPVITKKPTPTPTPTTIPTQTETLTPIPTKYVPPAQTYYAQPTVAPIDSSASGLSNDNYYTNSSGNQVHSPVNSTDGSVPAGATAKCNDGTYSFSQHHQGTCSGHGGVAQWL